MKTTKVQFDEFKAECERWIKFFGLLDWEISYAHKPRKNARAGIDYDQWGRIATMVLASDWNEASFAPNEICRVAFHEVVELLLAQINNMLRLKATYHDDDVEEEIHRVIRILENTVFK